MQTEPATDQAALLSRLVREPTESEWLEFKQNNSDPEAIGQLVSACANGAILAGKDRAFIVFGVEDKSRKLIGTSVRLSSLKKGNEPIATWLSHVISPRLILEFQDIEMGNKNFAIISIEASYERPVKFNGREYLRIGEAVKSLNEYPDHERSLWMATSRRKFEGAVALRNQNYRSMGDLIDFAAFYRLTRQPMPDNIEEVLRKFCSERFILDNLEGSYDVTNLGAILFAKNLRHFPGLAEKGVRVIQYAGKDKKRVTWRA